MNSILLFSTFWKEVLVNAGQSLKANLAYAADSVYLFTSKSLAGGTSQYLLNRLIIRADQQRLAVCYRLRACLEQD
ncbi:MAG: hypothetical protein AAF806_28600 [Bacteroidota bacterium]